MFKNSNVIINLNFMINILFYIYYKINLITINIEIYPNISSYIYFKTFRVHYKIPKDFKDYELSIIDKTMNSTENLKKFLFYAHGEKYINGILLCETLYTFRFRTTRIHAKNVFVSGFSVFGRGKELLSLYTHDKPPIEFPIIIKGRTDIAIALTHYPLTHSSPFYNYLFVVYAIPDSIVNIANIIIPSKSIKQVDYLFNILFPNSDIIRLSQREYIYVDNFYTVFNPAAGIQHYSFGILDCAKRIKNKFNLTKYSAHLYACSNRGARYSRHIQNFDEIFNQIKTSFSIYKWYYLIDDIFNYSQRFKEWSQIKILLAPTGSNLVLSFLMQEETGICLISGNRFDWEVVAITQVSNIFLFYVPFKNIKHFSPGAKNILNINIVLETLSDTIYAVENKKWKEETVKQNKNFKRCYMKLPILI